MDEDLKEPVKIVRGSVCGNIGKSIGPQDLQVFEDEFSGLQVIPDVKVGNIVNGVSADNSYQ